jgi:nucleotide-binding universal stress UspA family protein
VDFSASSSQAFRIADSLPRQGGARLLVLHVVEPPLFLAEPGDSSLAAAGDGNRLAALGEQLRESCIPANSAGLAHVDRATLEGRLREFYAPESTVAVAYLARGGDAAEVVLREAEGARCDLIVQGTHGRTGLRRLLVGSVAGAVLRRASCPVLTVRAALPGRTAPSEVAAPATAIP